jgi:hypothetical protein
VHLFSLCQTNCKAQNRLDSTTKRHCEGHYSFGVVSFVAAAAAAAVLMTFR